MSQPKKLKIAKVFCRDCGEVLNETVPFPGEEVGKVLISSVNAAGPCPRGCRSTFTDLNLNTKCEVEDYKEDV